jgi:hypothetical protein
MPDCVCKVTVLDAGVMDTAMAAHHAYDRTYKMPGIMLSLMVTTCSNFVQTHWFKLNSC